jgi:hypothetical protein
VALGLGLALGFLPILAYYAAHGGLAEFVSQYFFSKSGWRYAAGQIGTLERVVRLGDGLLGLGVFLTLPLLFAGLSVAAIAPGGRPGLRGVLLAGHFLVSFAGTAVGFRFYKGYYLQVLPVLCWLAAHPRGPLLRWFGPDPWPRFARARWMRGALAAALVAMVAPAAVAHARDLRDMRRDRGRVHDGASQAVARIIRANSGPNDRIWVWGRWGWPVYFHADRLSGTRFFKNLAVLTTNLSNTWRRPTLPTRFDPDSPWPEAIAELKKSRPAFIVVAANEDCSNFAAFQELLRKDYRRVPAVGQPTLSLYRRADRELKKPPTPPRPPAVARRPAPPRPALPSSPPRPAPPLPAPPSRAP